MLGAGGGFWPAAQKQGKRRKAWQEASRSQDGKQKKETEWAPEPRIDMAMWLKNARKNGIQVKGKSDMPPMRGSESSSGMNKRFSLRIQPRQNQYNGQGYARASAFLDIHQDTFRSQFQQ